MIYIIISLSKTIHFIETTYNSIMRYTVMIREDEDGGFLASCPDLPGCHSEGDTLEDAISNIKEAILCYLESLKKDNLPIPMPALFQTIDIASV